MINFNYYIENLWTQQLQLTICNCQKGNHKSMQYIENCNCQGSNTTHKQGTLICLKQ